MICCICCTTLLLLEGSLLVLLLLLLLLRRLQQGLRLPRLLLLLLLMLLVTEGSWRGGWSPGCACHCLRQPITPGACLGCVGCVEVAAWVLLLRCACTLLGWVTPPSLCCTAGWQISSRSAGQHDVLNLLASDWGIKHELLCTRCR
jgi:hypothetical protein